VHELTARHRRKAGSGPPANALIAWIGADPHLRTVAASHRRRTAASLPSNTLAVKAAAAACFALAGGGILGISTIVNDGLVAPLTSSPSPVLSQDTGPSRTAAPGYVAGVQPHPTVFPAPATTQSMVASRPTPQPIPAPAVPTPSGHIAADGPSTSPQRDVSPRRDIRSSEAAPAHPVAPRRADTLQPAQPIAPIQLATAGKPDPTGTLANSADTDDSTVPTKPSKPAGSDTKPDGRGEPVAAGGGTEPVAGAAADGDEAKHGSATFSPKSAPAHGSISAGGPSPRASSTAGQEAALHHVSPRH
jgi:hypothetical protein